MPTSRIEAFSDGVFAIIITLLVLEIHVPQVQGKNVSAALAQSLLTMAPKFWSDTYTQGRPDEQPHTNWHLELTAMPFRCLLIFCLFAGSPLVAQEKTAGGSRNEEAMSSFQAVNAGIDTILQEYEQLTGNALIRDSSLDANALPISISVPKPMPRSELVRIIESVMLLNNYALIPGPEPKSVKEINMNADKNPRSEGLPLYWRPACPSRR